MVCACWLMGRTTSRRSGDGLASQPHQNAEGRVSVWVVSDGAARLRSSVNRVNSKPAMEAKRCLVVDTGSLSSRLGGDVVCLTLGMERGG